VANSFVFVQPSMVFYTYRWIESFVVLDCVDGWISNDSMGEKTPQENAFDLHFGISDLLRRRVFDCEEIL
jgi:hypothetical protein